MRIAFDASVLNAIKTGIGYYAHHLLEALLEVSHHEILPLSHQPIETDFALEPAFQRLPGRIPFRNAWLQWKVPSLVRTLVADVAHYTNQVAPVRKTSRQVLSIHDMSLHLFPKHHPWRRRFTRRLVESSIRQADAILTGSRSIADDIIRITGIAPQRIHVIPYAAARHFARVNDPDHLQELVERYQLDLPTLLAVGTLEPRKNLSRLLEAFAESAPVQYSLTLVGAPGWGNLRIEEQIRRLGLKSRVTCTGYIPSPDLPGLYSLADALLYPSLYEGFGLPVMEAMACSTPVVTSQGGALEEHFSGAALLVDAKSVDSIQRAIETICSSPGLRQELSQMGAQRAAQYSWKKTAEQTLEIYHAVADS